MRYAAILGASVLAGLLACPAIAQSARPALDYGKAASIRDGCLAFAKERKFEIAIAIFDDAGRLMTFARTQLAGYKCPKSIEFVDSLPRNASGKILRRELRKLYWGEGRQVG